MGYRKIPLVPKIKGSRTSAERHRHLAELEITKLENELRLAQQQFPQVQQMRRARDFGDVIIECQTELRNGVKRSGVNIIVTGREAEKQPLRKKQECFCLPCFAHGYITAVTYDDPCSYYDVEVCQKEEAGASSYKGKWISPELGRVGTYVLFTGVLALDYGIYEVGQPVLVSLVPCIAGAGCGCDSGYNMCTLSAIPVGDWPCSVAISPVHLEDAEGNYWSIPKWKTVERKWGALY